jgi:hypothetical protein
MNTRAFRVEPSPYEEYVIDTILESSNGQKTLLEMIEQLSEERNTLRLQLAEHPQSDRTAALRMRIITSKLNELWAEVRQVRATRRVQLEEALGIDPSLAIN